MAKRYRSLRKGQRLFGGRIIFADHFFPQIKEPPCDDERLIEHIESRPGFGKSFWLYTDEDVKPPAINPESIPEGASEEGLSAAAVQLKRMGLNVNPALLKKQDAATEDPGEETPEPTEEPIVNVLPTNQYVRTANKSRLIEIIERHGWDDIDKNGHNVYLRAAIMEKIAETHQTQ